MTGDKGDEHTVSCWAGSLVALSLFRFIILKQRTLEVRHSHTAAPSFLKHPSFPVTPCRLLTVYLCGFFGEFLVFSFSHVCEVLF